MGGEILAESAAGQGSVFTFSARFEALPQADPRLAPARGASNLLEGKRVLVADDDPTSETLVYNLIESKGLRVDCVANGAQAVRELTRRAFDAVIMDIQMPELDGLAATRLIRDPATGCLNPDIPIIALTAHAFKRDEEACLEAGMTAYLSKPVEGSTLCAALESVLAGQAANPGGPQAGPAPMDLNVADTLRRLGGDSELLCEVFQAFASDLPLRLSELDSLLASGNLDPALRAAHSLKGASMNTGAEKVRDAAATVYDHLKAGRPDLATRAMPALHGVFQLALAQVLDFLRENDQMPPTP
jgi:CheY-like chemotaxis protein/HPt (histidine-containing phosphotransfer) domain-containing protein